jgi:glycosyltransferase involved in cell wall biosynthesis
MSAGKPVIASMNLDGDAPKLIKKSESGFCVPPGDYKALAEKIMLLYENPSLREKLGRNGRKYIEENLSARKAAEIYEQLFYKILAYK